MFDLSPFNKRNDDMFHRVEKLMNEFFSKELLPVFEGSMNSFRTDIKERKDAYYIEADLPGVTKDNVQLEIERNQVTIRAKWEDTIEVKDQHGQILRQERKFGEFVRHFYVENIDHDEVVAKLEQGVLKIKLPKLHTKDDDFKRRIDIQD